MHDLNAYVTLLKRDSTIFVLGCREPLEPLDNTEVVLHRKDIAGSLIGSISETQELLQFCAPHDVAPDIQVIGIDELNDAHHKDRERRSALSLCHRHGVAAERAGLMRRRHTAPQ